MVINAGCKNPAKEINQATKLSIDSNVTSDLNAEGSSCDLKSMNSPSTSQANVSIKNISTNELKKSDNGDVANSSLSDDSRNSRKR